MQKIRSFLKKETVFAVSLILALMSMIVKPPDSDYWGYIDFRVLGILLGLMLIMSGLQRVGIFDIVCQKLLSRVQNIRQLAWILIMLCFFSSMVITNDVALVAFVPFAIVSLKKAGYESKAIWIVVMQTIAANLGSMLLPSGNPQNLYLYNLSEMSFGEFIVLMLPYVLVAFAMLCILVLCLKKEPIQISAKEKIPVSKRGKINTVVYGILFAMGILTVCRILPYEIFLTGTLAAVGICDIKAYKNVDYFLLLTFMCFFVFIGNIGSIETVRNTLEDIVKGREVVTGIIVSQVISNVPAALMLSGFTDHCRELIVGVDLGGLGTLIASMASLISYKIYAENFKETKGKYLLQFTAYNIIFLGLLFGLWSVMRQFG